MLRADENEASTRVIIHLDLDCYYAQVEQRRLNIPDGQPVAVQQWGFLLAVNYAARKFGVERGDFADDAKKKCPQIHLVFDRTHQKAILRRYRVASREIFSVLNLMVSAIEKAGIDEAFLDVTDMAKERLAQMTVFSSDFCQDPANHDTKVFCNAKEDEHTLQAFPLTNNERLLCIGAVISREIRQAVYGKLGYTCSTGIASNKLLAKLASPLNKPNGQVVAASRFVSSLMKSLSMRKVRGLGGKLGKQLESIYQSLDPAGAEVLDQGERPAEDASKKLTAHAFVQRCGMDELSKHVGQETAAYVHQICQGDDGDEQVEEKKVQVKMLSCVKQFDQRSGSALSRVEQLEYWVRLLCEEMVLRCEDERIENKRFPSQLTIQFTRAKPDEKPRTRKLGIAQDTTVDELHTAAMNVMQLHLDSLFPLAALSMHAKNFHDLNSQAVTTISSFFTRNLDEVSSANATAQRVEDDIKQFTAKRGRDGSPSSRRKISVFFGPSNSNSNDVEEDRLMAVTDGHSCTKSTSTCTEAESTSSSTTHYCNECNCFVSEPRVEHADFHFAMKLSAGTDVQRKSKKIKVNFAIYVIEDKKTMGTEEVPTLFAMAMRYQAGDDVKTSFGPGCVRKCSNHTTHVEVTLAGGVVLYARCGEVPIHTRVMVMPLNRREGVVLNYIVPVQKYQVLIDGGEGAAAEEKVQNALEERTKLLTKEELRLTKETRIRTSFGLGNIINYTSLSDSYAVQLDGGSVGYLQAKDVACVDLRLLAKIPKPLSAERIYDEFPGRITRDDALLLSLKARQTYDHLQIFCEQHANTISFISTNASYGDQYTKALASLLDPSFADATKRLKDASGKELERLKEMAVSAKTMLEGDLLEGMDPAAFFAKAANVLSQLKNSDEIKNLQSSLRERASSELASARQKVFSHEGTSGPLLAPSQEEKKLVLSQILQVVESKMNAQKPHLDALKASFERQDLQSEVLSKIQQHESDIMKAQETIAHLEQMASKRLGVNSVVELDPSMLVQKAEELLPRLSLKAEVLAHTSEKYWMQMQQTSNGQTLMKKAKALVQSVENPDEFCDNVTKAIGEIKLDKLAEWGSSISKNREKRQKFVDQMKDHCLDFLTSVLPTLKVDTISGVEDDIAYSISELDLSNFRVKKERVSVRMGTVVDEELFTVRATHLTALLKGFDWTFEQKYFPYLHGGGVADAALSGGAISLGFKAEKKVVNEETREVKPVLVLSSITIEIRQELKLTVQGSWFSAVYNVLSTLFAELIREYLAKTMETKLLKHTMKLLGTLNKQMDEYWPLIFQLLDIRMEDLPNASPWRGAEEVEIQSQEVECTFTERGTVPFAFAKVMLNKHVVISRILDIDMQSAKKHGSDENHDSRLTENWKRVPVGSSVLALNGLSCSKLTVEELRGLLETLPLPFTMRFSLLPESSTKSWRQQMKPQPEFTTFIFRQKGPFGLRLRARPLAPCGVIIMGFTANFDGKKCPAELSGKIRVGQLLTKVNNVDLRFKTLSKVLAILHDLKSRPVTMQFASSPDAVIKLREWPPMIETEDASSFTCDEDDPSSNGRQYIVLSAFARVPSFAQRTHLVEKGDVLLQVNDVSLTGPDYTSFADIMEALRVIVSKKESMRAVFVSREHFVAMQKELQERRHSCNKSMDQLNEVDQKNEECGQSTKESEVLNAVGATATITTTSDAPVDVLKKTLMKEIVFPKAPLGILFGNWKDEAVYIRAFVSSPGPAEKTGLLRVGHAIIQVCGHAVPREPTPGIIEEMIMKVSAEARAQDSSSSKTTAIKSAERKPKYTLTVRNLELERELMK